MTKTKKILLGLGALLGAVVLVGAYNAPRIASALQLYNQVDQYTYFAYNNATTSAATMLQYGGGTLHTVTVTNPAASSIITLYDTSNGVITAPTTATATIWVDPIGSTSTATGTITFSLNGQTLTTASISNGSSTTDVATSIKNTITSSSASLGVTASASSNVVTITASVVGPVGNINLSSIASQDGFNFYNTFNNSKGTPIITQITLPATTTYLDVPIAAAYDVVYKNGLAIQQTNGTSSVTVSWQQN